MFISKTRLPHILAPSAYFDAEHYQAELESVLHPAWHVVGTTSELQRDGDFITTELLGQPIQVRKFEGELKALSNICAHRHCLMTNKKRGNSPRMQCQYHGWEYGPDGVTRKIPEPKNFAPYKEGRECVPVYRVETCGQIVWVCLSQEAPNLREFLGEYYEIIDEQFGETTKQFLKFDVQYKANWKVPIENSLEAYHVPFVHEATFREDPGEDRSEHFINDRSTAFSAPLPFSPHSGIDTFVQRSETGVMKLLGVKTTGKYWQHHVYPNLLLSFTDAINLIHCVTPTGPNTSSAIVRQFGNLGKSKWGPGRLAANFWGHFKGLITKKIVSEDLELIPDIQAGLEKSQQEGVLGRCEERIHAFQEFVSEATKTRDSNMDQTSYDKSKPTLSMSDLKR